MLSARSTAMRARRASTPSPASRESSVACSKTSEGSERVRRSGSPVVPPVLPRAARVSLPVRKAPGSARSAAFSSSGQEPRSVPPPTRRP
jgi:hypothetical protein